MNFNSKLIIPAAITVAVLVLGEIRGIGGFKKRVQEARKLGFTNIISSENAKSLQQAIKLALTF